MKSSQRDMIGAGLGLTVLVALAIGRPMRAQAEHFASGAVPLRLAYFPNVTHAPALVGVADGEFQKQLTGYGLSTKVVNAGPEAMEALLAGAIDFAYVGPSPAINTFLKSHGKALRIIAGACSGGASLMRRSDVCIDSIRDLDGKRVAVPQLGGTQDVSCRTFMARNGLQPRERGGTVEIMPIQNPDILALFKSKQLDAAWVPEPWASRLKNDAGAQTVVDERTLWPGGRFATTVVVVREQFAEKHPDAVADFVRAHAATVRWLNAHPADAKRIVNGELKRLTGKSLSQVVLDDAWKHVEFTTQPDMDSLRAFADAAFTTGYAKERPSGLEAILDTSAIVQAAKIQP